MKFSVESLGSGATTMNLLICCAAVLLFFFGHPYPASGSEKWSGVDEMVIEKYATNFGRDAREPLIDTDQGDLLLFVFLLAGAAGGFAAGYSWRMLTERGRRDSGREAENREKLKH